jgi:DNA-binding winged helix-turn-helix (wHTH) protein
MPEGASRIYHFGPFVLDVADRSLKREGAPVPLTPKTFDLLVALVENAGRLVDKDSLLRTVWPDVAVEEGNLTKGVFSLRQLLEAEAGPRYIETVPKRGYRFIGEVTTGNKASSITSQPSPESPSENSIAVMPFTDMSAARDQEFFCEGMSEEIINAPRPRPRPARRLLHVVSAVQGEGDRHANHRTGPDGHVATRGKRSKSGGYGQNRCTARQSSGRIQRVERSIRSKTRRHLLGSG